MIAYLDMPSGLSGDMFLSCLIDAGWSIDELQATISRLRLPAGAIALAAGAVMRGPLRAMLVSVKTAERQPHRNLDDIRQIIQSSDLPTTVKDRAIATFTRLAIAEAGVHGTAPEQVHFHEVGGLDTIADIVGVCAGLDALHISQLYASPLPLAGGWVGSAHGSLPLPAPATLALLAAVHAPIRPAPSATPTPAAEVRLELADNFAVHKTETGSGVIPAADGNPKGSGVNPPPVELVTPTAAALLAELATFQQPPMRLQRIGIGAGQRIFAWPNVARLWLGEAEPAGPMVQIDANIDDMNPQFYPAAMERLFAAGAADVWLTPIQMKKGRPAITLSILCPAAIEAIIADILLQQTTTLGLRVHPVTRHEAAREFRAVQTLHGPVRVKLKLINGQVIAAVPEYDDCKKLADDKGLPVHIVHDAAQAAARQLLAPAPASTIPIP
jgi:hypothetical protein